MKNAFKDIESIKRVSLKPNDVLAVSFKDTVSQSNLDYLIKELDEIFPNNKIMFLCNGAELQIIDGGTDNV